MSEKIIFATGNEGKMREIRAILGDLGMEVISMREAGFTLNITGISMIANGAPFTDPMTFSSCLLYTSSSLFGWIGLPWQENALTSISYFLMVSQNS